MASTFIESGQIKRRTKKMMPGRAQAFAKLLAAGKRLKVTDITVISAGDKARVEYTPVNAQTTFRFFSEQQTARSTKAIEIRKYDWRRIGKRRWSCRNHQGVVYTISLDRLRCSCPDFPRINSVGGLCKHIICAEEAERRYQSYKERGDEDRKTA